MQKVLMLTTFLNAGGRERQIISLINAISNDKNVEIHLVIVNDSDLFFSEVFQIPIKITILNIENHKSLKVAYELNKIVRNFKPDIIHAWDEHIVFFSLPIALIHRIKFINGSLRHGILKLKPRHLLRNILFRLSPVIIANSFAGYKANRLRITNKRFVLYNGIDETFNKFNMVPSNKGNIMLEIGANKSIDCNVIISVSRLHPIKDYFTVIEALKILKNEGFDFIYLIIGDGPMKKSIQAKIDLYDLKENIFLIGLKANIEIYLSIADIFLHSSEGEGCSNVILEAMYSGLPVIASATGGTPEIVSEQTGFLFKYKSVNDLYNKLRKLLTDKPLRLKLGENGYKMIRNNYTLDNMCSNYLNIMNKL